MSLSDSPGVSTGTWLIFSRPLFFFSSVAARSSQVSISARVRSAHASTVFKRLMKKSTARALMWTWSWVTLMPSMNSCLA